MARDILARYSGLIFQALLNTTYCQLLAGLNGSVVSLCPKLLHDLTHSLMFLLPGKILIIGGSIANFTNVAATFKVSDDSELSANAHSHHNPRPFSPVRSCAGLTVHLCQEFWR